MEKVLFGIKNVHYAPITVSESGTVTFGTPVALPGASEIALSTVGDPVKVYADNVVYVKFSVNQGYEGDLSVYAIPDAFSQAHLGMTIDPNGVLVEAASATQQDFALMYEFDTETTKTKRTVLYCVSASRPEINGATKENSIDPQPFAVPIVASPALDTEYVKASIVGDSNDATWASWFSSVYTPAASTQYRASVKVQVGTTPIANALVVCGDKIGRTDSTGFAYFMLPNGTYDILVSATGHTAKADTVTVSSAAVSKTVTLVA